YCSKKASSTYFIAVTDKQSDVDLCLHGFDDVYMEPIPKNTISQKYQKMKFVPLPELPATMRDTVNTPESTISLESVRTAEYSQSSTCDSGSSGMDIQDISISDLKSTLSVPLCSKSPFLSEGTETEGGKSPLMDPLSPNWCRVEHASKEKQRRERIKDSCDQLRVLLPYVKGRKTDMASILEMTVDYLKIVNAALPQDFQSQVIEIMSNGNPTLEVRLGEVEKASTVNKKVTRRKISDLDLSPLEKKQQLFQCDTPEIMENHRSIHFICRHEIGDQFLSLPYFPPKNSSSKLKRPHMALVSTTGEVNSPSVIYLPTGNITPIKETKKESILGEVTNQSHHFTDNQFSHLFTEADIPGNHMFPPGSITSDMFPYQSHTQMNMNTQLARVSASDRGDLTAYGGIYFDGAFCHYYPQLQDSSSSSSYFGPGGTNEYVNPNAVLPMTSYVPRPAAFTSARKYERTSAEFERYGTVDPKSDIYNNNNCNVTGLKPSNNT
ncbi:unnamed protein product, partial [Candidula unifasciata]